MNDWRLKFLKYHAQHPEVADMFDRYALQLLSAGRRCISHGTVIERIRWDSLLKGTDDDGFKINQNYAAFYARRFEAHHPEHSGVFRRRQSAADRMDMECVV